ncbi:MAG TPA: serine--tRNA ligase [Ktedonobacter sp.]|nr:serine--tRNA ligase [Ktedonobacter sp.]
MLNLDFIRQHPDVVLNGLRKRHDEQNIQALNTILQLTEQRRVLATRSDALYISLKQLKETLHNAPVAKRSELSKQIKATTQDVRALESQITDIASHLHLLLLNMPNIPHESVPEGMDDEDDREELRWGEPLTFHFEPEAHWDVGAHLGIFDSESALRIAGSRFMTLKGMGARLERALISFMLDVHTREHGYTEIMPPFLVKRSVMQGAGQLPKFENQAYQSSEDELFLNPTAEVPLIGMHSDTILPPETLPLRYVAWTSAFRREVGATSRARGLLRLHQFNKIELFQYVEPQLSYTTLEQMLSHAESILRQLDLPYRVVTLCSANLPFSSAKTFDIQVWTPGQNCYMEISSVSNCETFQTRRANIRYRPNGTAHAEYPHTLNASGLAVGRTMAAILETYQQADGSVVVPKVLRPFMGTALLTPS